MCKYDVYNWGDYCIVFNNLSASIVDKMVSIWVYWWWDALA
jgi:hypothetical protein